MKNKPVTLFVGTRKGAFLYRGDAKRKKWTVDGPHFLAAPARYGLRLAFSIPVKKG